MRDARSTARPLDTRARNTALKPVLLRTPQYLRAVAAASEANGTDPTEAQVLAALRRAPGAGKGRLGFIDYITARDRFWREPSVQDLGYWLTWAVSAGYLSKTGDTYRPTGEGSRLAKLPARAEGAVRAALTAGRQSADNA